MDDFPIKPYTKKELSLLYFPGAAAPHTAVNHLMAWIARCAELSAALSATGYCKTQKCFTPRQVRLIVRYLGEP